MDRARILALHLWNLANRRAAKDYYAHPTEFADRKYCRVCSRIPKAHNHCEVCDDRLAAKKRMQKRRAA